MKAHTFIFPSARAAQGFAGSLNSSFGRSADVGWKRTQNRVAVTYHEGDLSLSDLDEEAQSFHGHRRRSNPVSKKHKSSKHKAPTKKYAWWPWALGATGIGLIAYLLLRPKTALAAGQPTPPKIIPGPGNIQISAGSRVPLTAPLKAHYGDGLVTVPAGTIITIAKLDADGMIHFPFAGNDADGRTWSPGINLTSPVEDYSAVVGAPV